MKELYFKGGPLFMAILTIMLVITTAWIIYHFIIAYKSKQANQEKLLRRISYGKTIGLFTLIVGIYGQMTGLFGMFSVLEEVHLKGDELNPELLFGAIKVTMICTMYGILIYLISLLLWFVANLIIEKKFNK
jgi:hypothetical protein